MIAVVVYNRSVARSELSRILWDSPLNPRVRHRLRQLSHAITRRTGQRLILSRREFLVASDGISSDLDDLHAALLAGRVHEAALLVRKGFLKVGSGDVSPSFRRWRDKIADEVERRVSTAARALWESATQEADWKGALDAAEALYSLRPLTDEAVTRVVEARARAGHLRAAEEAYAEYTSGTGENASAKVHGVIERVRRLGDETKALDIPELGFVGRTSALSDLAAVLDDALVGTTSIGLICGEAGIGKSRLLAEVRRIAVLRGLRCLVAEPVELERRIALNPLIDALTQLDLGDILTSLDEPWRSVMRAVLPPGAQTVPSVELPFIQEQGLSRRLLDAFAQTLAKVANDAPTLLLIDDLHWADATTVAAIRFMHRRYPDLRLGLIATVRPSAVSPRDPVHPYLADEAGAGLHRVLLKELDTAEARDLLSQIGGDRFSESEMSRICEIAGQHPLYLIEIARECLAGRLSFDSTKSAQSVPISIKQLINSRLSQVSATVRRTAALLAVVDKPVGVWQVSQLTGQSVDEAAATAEALRSRRLVNADRDRIWIAHDLFRRALYDDLSETSRAAWHRRVGELLREEKGDLAAGELATHFDRAGDRSLATSYAWTAAEKAWSQGAVAEAAHFFELVTRNEVVESRRARATARLATALHLCRDMRRALPALELAATRLRAAGDFELSRRMEVRRVEAMVEGAETPVDELVDRLRMIRRDARSTGDWVAVSLALDVELQILILDERLDDAQCLVDPLREVTEHAGNEAKVVAARALAVGLMLVDAPGALQAAREAVRGSNSLSEEHKLRSLNRLVLVLLLQGRLTSPQYDSHLQDAEELARKSGDLLQRFSWEGNLGAAWLDAGDFDRAGVHFDRAGALLGNADMTFPRINLACNLGELELTRGDHDAATKHFAAADQYMGPAVPKYTRSLVNAGLGLCALETGALSNARLRENEMGSAPSIWYYDPTVILMFKARLQELRGGHRAAAELLQTEANRLEGRLVMAWLKVQLLTAKLFAKNRDRAGLGVARRGFEASQQLNQPIRASEFKEALERLATC